jgi:hypothetical protein
MSQNMSIHTQEGLSISKNYIILNYICLAFSSLYLIITAILILFPNLSFIAITFTLIYSFAVIIITILTIIARCKMVYRAYEFHKNNSTTPTLYTPSGTVWSLFIPF